MPDIAEFWQRIKKKEKVTGSPLGPGGPKAPLFPGSPGWPCKSKAR